MALLRASVTGNWLERVEKNRSGGRGGGDGNLRAACYRAARTKTHLNTLD
jgi:hypothetical protein